ncbi:hypothetical protein BREVNS_1414 [Brevinematales bacterium NS]|nr:hypothetical protein BREVNS_1414 [Brevinematales bacterium NS]
MKWFDRFSNIFFVYGFVILVVYWYIVVCIDDTDKYKNLFNMYEYETKVVRLFLKETFVDFVDGLKDNTDFSLLEAYKIFDKKFNYLYLLPNYMTFSVYNCYYYEPVSSDCVEFKSKMIEITNDFDKYYEKVVSNLYLWRSYDK